MAEIYPDQIKKYQNILKTSKTALTPNVKPTQADINAQSALLKAKGQQASTESEALKTAWYNDAQPRETKDSYLSNLFNVLAAPVYASAGAVEALLGKGTEKGLANIPANIKEKGTYGDILRSYGMNNLAAMPLGFALDVAMDPLNWLTLGTYATVPKIATGFAKGGVKGAAVGAKSAALERAENLIKMVPGLSKRAFPAEGEAALGLSGKIARKITEKSVDAAREFDILAGRNFDAQMLAQYTKEQMFPLLERKLTNSRAGQALVRGGAYRPVDNLRSLRSDELQGLKRVNAIADDLDKSSDLLLSSANKSGLDSKVIEADMARQIDITETVRENMQKMKNLLGENSKYWNAIKGADDGTKRIISDMFKYYETESKSVDKMVAKWLSSNRGRKTLDTYATYIGLFKNAKIGGNLLSAGTNAVIGNLVMTGMAGIDVINTGFLNNMAKAIKVIKGGDRKVFNVLMNDPAWVEVMNRNPKLFQSIFGINPNLMTRGVEYIAEVAKEIEKQGGNINGLDDVIKAFDKTIGEKVGKIAEKMGTAEREAMRRGRSTVARTLDEGNETAFITSEIYQGPYVNFVKKIEAMANSNKPFAKAFHWYLTKPMEAYNRVDQTYRLGLALHLSQTGITERELMLLSKRLKIPTESYTRIPGKNLYRLDPDTAMDASAEIYMNYMAMPSFVKAMRNLPIVGSPFISFMYGMSAIAAKTALYNPAYFNKIQFLIREMGGNQSPLEKEALNSPYYAWFNKQGMAKLPFFTDNPLYLNIENMVPYYTMNIFQPSDRTYDSRFGGTIAAILDKVPFLKTPEGQVMFDYLIQPLILQDEDPEGTFGQKLWPADSNLAEKAGATLRALAETVTPPMMGYGAFATLMMPESVRNATTPLVPNYRYRSLANALQGKSSIGAMTREDPAKKTLRTSLSMAGWPFYQLDLKNVK